MVVHSDPQGTAINLDQNTRSSSLPNTHALAPSAARDSTVISKETRKRFAIGWNFSLGARAPVFRTTHSGRKIMNGEMMKEAAHASPRATVVKPLVIVSTGLNNMKSASTMPDSTSQIA
mmetsp:Transcript_46147/g.108007  ORF Transcript_46147/g.108007 Transcript_46147/m.108007 type:complete len:119 (+) Transcript_46147:273-629(+)